MRRYEHFHSQERLGGRLREETEELEDEAGDAHGMEGILEHLEHQSGSVISR